MAIKVVPAGRAALTVVNQPPALNTPVSEQVGVTSLGAANLALIPP